MLPDIPAMLRECAQTTKPLTPPGLAAFFGVPERHFHQTSPDGPIRFHQAGLQAPVAYALRGTLFWPADGQIVRGCPRVLPTSDYSSDPIAVYNEAAFFAALAEAEAAIEVKEPGISVRLYARARVLDFATDIKFDASNPLLGAGIDNVRALGIDCAGQAKRLMAAGYPDAARLARLGYVPVFEMVLPEREALAPVERPDLVLTDVIDPDHCFVDRLEKERIAEDYSLRPATLHGRMARCASPAEMYSRLRSLEHVAAKDDVLGYVVKVPWHSDQVSIKVEAPGVRQAWTTVAEGDLSAALEAASEDFDGSPLFNDPNAVEELLLEYLGDRRRSVRWQVHEYLLDVVRQPRQ